MAAFLGNLPAKYSARNQIKSDVILKTQSASSDPALQFWTTPT